MDNNKNRRPTEKAKEVAEAYKGFDSRQNIKADITGSYTGTSIDGSRPEQDGDDI